MKTEIPIVARELILENRPILIIAGGTGGHVMPALAVASELSAQGMPVHWMGTAQGIEAKIVNAQGIPMHYIEVQSLRRKGILGWLKAPFQVSKAIIQSIKIIRRVKPSGVLSMGGYVSGPGSIAAWLCGCPLVIHEQNAKPGLTNRLLAPIANAIMTGFPNCFSKQAQKTYHTGNPVRLSIMMASKNNEALDRPIRLLIVGGSLGASILNQTLPQALGALDPSIRPEVWHQTGQKQQKETQSAYEAQGMNAQVEPFIEDMAKAYAWADCVICRAGALTIAELATVGLASILVPLPHSADDHQTYNAKYLTQNGAALLLPQSQLSVSTMTGLLSDFLKDANQLREQGAKARSLAKPNATQEVVHYLLKTIKKVHPCTI